MLKPNLRRPSLEILEDRTTPSLTPLNELGTALYQGYAGGLYGGGQNDPPGAFMASGQQQAALIQPLDAQGNPDPVNGKIVLLTLGMSNTHAESDAFIAAARADGSLNPHLVIVNGAQSGEDATAWAAHPSGGPWGKLASILAARGVTAAQVQVVWNEHALRRPGLLGGFPVAAQDLRADLEAIARYTHLNFPNVKLAYWSSMTHTFTTRSDGLQPEPWAYETGFSVQWMETEQIAGTGGLNYDASKGIVDAPQSFWGPYLWADGTRADGFSWVRSDTGSDGTHPSKAGSAKVADALLAFFKSDPTTAPWFLAPVAPAGMEADLARFLLEPSKTV